jgi:molybdenum cofactor biosynthesis enzyme MoaA
MVEPGARRDLVEITAGAHAAGLYTNLITSAIGITDKTLGALTEAGLDHVQISIQDSDAASADHIAGYDGAFARKRALAAEVVRHQLLLTVNAVVHRANIDRIGEMVDLALPWREPDRDCARAILRLGAQEPRRADAIPRAGRACNGGGGGTTRAPSRPHRH